MSELQQALVSAITGNAVLFVGSGVGFLARSASGEPIASSEKLIREMFKELNEEFDPRAPLDRIAEHYGRERGFPNLYALIKRELQCKGIENDDYRKFLEADWKRIYTTNFDNVIELARPGQNSLCVPFDPKEGRRGSIIHLNGYIDNIDPINFDQTANLTSWSYASNSFAGSSAAQFFRTDIRSAKHVIFVGYSLASDLDISRLMAADRTIPGKFHFILSPDVPGYDRTTLERYGYVHEIGVEALLQAFISLRNVEVGAEKPLPTYSFFSISPHDNDGGLDHERALLRDQVLFGEVDLNFLVTAQEAALVGAKPRLINRRISQSISDQLIKGERDSVVVHGDIGSGKTFTLVEVCRKLYSEGYEIFWVNNGRYDPEELQNVAERNAKRLVVFDGFISNSDVIREFMSIRGKNCAVLLSARTVVYELSRESIDGIMGEDHNVVELRPLDAEELLSLDSLLLGSGLLGAEAQGTPQTRVAKYQSALGSSIFRILVDLVQSRYVSDQIKAQIEPITNDSTLADAFAAILAGTVLECELDIDDWDYCIGADVVDRLSKDYEEITRHFIRSDGYQFISKPTVLGSELLREAIPTKRVSNGLIKIYRYCVNNQYKRYLQRARETVMRYSRIERMFGDKDKYRNLIMYYDDMQALPGTDNNSQYWLQKAIAASIHGNYSDRGMVNQTYRFFQTAYARAPANNNRQRLNIDNYYARFRLMHALNQNDPLEAVSLAEEAITRLMRQIHLQEAKHYPFKAGRTIADIIIKFKEDWAEDQRAKIVHLVRRLISEAEKWLEQNGNNRDVRSLITDCSGVVDKI